ncbi:MAG: hypothetical protein ACRD0K_15610 [Egibacteraceae bacterium]
MSHPDGLPDLFLDRSLGRVQVARGLRAAGLRLVTLAEHYGIPADERVADTTWLAEAGTRGWVVFMKDERIRRNWAERGALTKYHVRCFCLTRQDLIAADMTKRFLGNLPAVTAACSKPGPFLYAVHANRLVRLLLEPRPAGQPGPSFPEGSGSGPGR